ncbi:surfeit locus protein 6-domain-containing protein [Boeremia exigua]|uniref:surfeit locus protein 6-domain-containing protein n=1 Tax=Boeremia exigua TaxID=749465 RepID=UPI001E8CCBEB|nr:surfeit locus protein 6-domain-containing protein [Boeremia exigua]KAH6643943.1 surfeit locus protein 6-domain-containing protein [Boeremia exigua]
MPDDLESRLKSHARAFEGLMSLIPAKEYYGKDESITSTQWQKKKKQTTEERQAAKRAKLDPASHKSAQDVLDENARKRKREIDGEVDDDLVSEAPSSDLDMDIVKETPLEGIKKLKKQKTKNDADTAPEEVVKEGRTLTKAEVKAEKKKEKKKEKQATKKQQEEKRKASQAEFKEGLTAPKETKKPQSKTVDEDEDEEEDDGLEDPEDRIEALDVSGLVDVEEGQSTAPTTTANSNISAASDASSSTSVAEEAPTKDAKKEKKPLQIDEKSQEEFRARLNAKLEAMRAARKADGPDGRPAKNRAELIESRRKKEAARQVAKKSARQDAKEDEARQKAEEQLARIRGGSGSPSIFPARSPERERNFNFGRVAWEDGQELEGGLSKFLDSRKKKGKSDTKTALEAAQKKQARINGFDETKRKEIQEKELWLNAKKRAQGEKVFDDVNLLKKSLKRQQKQKDKSKQEWKERLTNVTEGKEKRQKKREENLKQRRDSKGVKGKKKGAPKKGGKKPAKRPGFEGTFKGK